ncbi:glycosyltransferase [Candidatus Uabimicrobium sp. HlEnr_7]|uniref:UDP-N-acetylglucosamine--N-acetylmuramyl- (pentapeptide) pyrophosphoryl-undecaprenol N-acetylglucosamine transferase n=1 Tax=Candidatus Uabimicrobium helgolandensis TaxID=3095367 RepID=UPI003557887C
MFRSSKKTIMFVGGGSGGHLFPGIAVADELCLRVKDCNIVFFVTSKSIDMQIMKNTRYPWYVCSTIAFPRKKSLSQHVNFWRKFLVSWWESEHLLRIKRPSCVVGLGGFGSFTAGSLALLHQIPVLYLEGNIVAGKVVRYLSPWSKGVFCQYENCFGLSPDKILASGLPIRQQKIYPKVRSDVLKILVMGGSQGAKCIENNVLNSLVHLKSYRSRISFIHIAGKESCRAVEATYLKYGFHAQVHRFISQMDSVYSQVDLVVSRAGGSSLAEITSFGIAAILIPFSAAADDHQRKNAMHIKNLNAGIVIEEKDLQPLLLAQTIANLIDDKSKIEQMSCFSKKLGKPRATLAVVDYIAKNFLGSLV